MEMQPKTDSLSNRFLRNKELINQDSLNSVCIIGAGGIGSFIVQSLTMMGWKELIIWDADIMENHNVSSTAYPLSLIGRKKTEAASVLHSLYADSTQSMTLYDRHYTPSDEAHPRTIICTDNMESRRMAFEEWYRLPHKEWFVDARMGATTVELVTESNRVPDASVLYETNYISKRWQPTHTVPEAPCSMKHSVFATQHIASLVTSQVYNLVGGLAYYDYIWTSLSPNSVQLGTLIRPIIINSQEEE